MTTPASRSTSVFVALLALVERMMAESGDPTVARDFNAADWLETWLAGPLAALGGRSPADLVDTSEGFDVVRRLLLSQQTSSYW